MDLGEVDCVDREATSAICDLLPDRIGSFLTSYGFEVALYSIHAHGDAINERERLRVFREHRGKLAPDNVSTFCVRLPESDVLHRVYLIGREPAMRMITITPDPDGQRGRPTLPTRLERL